MQLPENIPKIPLLVGIVLLVAVTAVGAITLGGLTDQTAPQQQGISDEEAQKIIDNENATQPALDNVTFSEEPATAEEIEAFNKYAKNEEASANAAHTTSVIYNPVSQPSAPTQPAYETTQVTGGQLVSDEATDPNDIPDESAYEEPQENYDDDTPEYEDEEPIPDDIEIPTDEDDEGYYTDEPYDPFDDDVFDEDEDGDSEESEGEGDE